MAKLTTAKKNTEPKSEFGLPEQRKYPMPDASHARNAKARASQMQHQGKLSAADKKKVDAKADEATRHRVRAYLGGDGTDPIGILVRAAYASVARLAILPVQDVFGLGSEARMNRPGKPSGNWRWRMGADDASPSLAEYANTSSTVTMAPSRIFSDMPFRTRITSL